MLVLFSAALVAFAMRCWLKDKKLKEYQAANADQKNHRLDLWARRYRVHFDRRSRAMLYHIFPGTNQLALRV